MTNNAAATNDTATADGAPRRRSAGRRVTPERLRRIVEAAAEIAADSGLAAVTMQAVAKQTGYVRPVVYDCYGTPENILLTLLDQEASALFELMGGAPTSRVATGEDLVDSLMRYFDAIAARPRAWQLFVLPTEGVEESVRARMQNVREHIRSDIAQWLESALESTRTPADTDALSVLVLAAVDGIAGRITEDPAHIDPSRIRAFLRALVAGVSLAPHDTDTRANDQARG